MSPGKDEFGAKDLAIPIYLNQRIVFDLLAIFEDGFSHLKTIKTSTSETEASKQVLGGSIGASNVFAFLGLSFSAERNKSKESGDQEETTQERVHTPTSLFAKCRANLAARNLLSENITVETLPNLKTGDFIEFKAKLRKNPIQDTLGNIKAIVELIAPFSQASQPAKQSGKPKGSSQSNKEMIRQIDALLSMVAEKDTFEIVGDLTEAKPMKTIIPCQIEFFSRGDPTELVDGDFFVLGKVVQIAVESSETINLLRKTALGKINVSVLNQFVASLSSLGETGLTTEGLETKIGGPAVLVLPIAIYI